MNKKYKIIIAGIIIIGIIGLMLFLVPNEARTKNGEAPIDPLTVLDDVPQNDFNALKTKYHKSINKLFNEAFSRITSNKGQTRAPDESDEKDEACLPTVDPLNVSTYCVAVRSAQLYADYVSRINYLKGYVKLSAETMSQKDLLANTKFQIDAIDKEILDSRKVLDTTIGAYKEFQYAYPMHKAYEKTFDLLVKYRDLLAEIRGQVEVFPLKFINATTSKCE